MEEDVRPIRVVHYGLGATGKEIARLVHMTPGMTIVGGIDQDQTQVGNDIGTILELDAPIGVVVSDSAAETLERTHPDIVVLATTSLLSDAYTQLITCLRARANVISTCEELVYPCQENHELASKLDHLAKLSGVTLLGVGINPGFVMDLLPLLMTAPCTCIRRIRVSRVIDATVRRASLQHRIGAGLTPTQFRNHMSDKRMRHVGLCESLFMIANSIGWEIERVDERIDPVVADDWVLAGHITIAPGQVAGMRQTATGFVQGHDAIMLDWQTFVGGTQTYDAIKIDGIPSVDLTIAGGLHGARAAAAVVLHAMRPTIAARAGLITVVDIPPMHYALPALDQCGWLT